jgi:2-polyprenyl-3-methyl-5-hydroxy-6-metoxy-1,4-benzoquinol methylase
VFSDIEVATYEAGQHNVWHDDELSSDTVLFYGRARERAHAAFLYRHPPRGAGRLLDVGCGLGFFLERAAARGWDAYGCEPSPSWAARARDRVGGSRVHTGPPAHGMFAADRFDLITAWDVLEHVYDPIPFLRTLAGLLTDAGRLFIRTPNLAWIRPTYAVRRTLGEKIELGPLNHVVYYDAATLRRALGRAGLAARSWPVFPPPQVGFGNRDPELAGRQTAVVRLKNAHARFADRLALASRGRLVWGADLDVCARLSGAAGSGEAP